MSSVVDDDNKTFENSVVIKQDVANFLAKPYTYVMILCRSGVNGRGVETDCYRSAYAISKRRVSWVPNNIQSERIRITRMYSGTLRLDALWAKIELTATADLVYQANRMNFQKKFTRRHIACGDCLVNTPYTIRV